MSNTVKATTPEEPATSAARAGEPQTRQPFSNLTGAVAHPARHPGKTYSPGLEQMDSTVPGSDRRHVRGPMQNPVDPVAAGLDLSDIEAADTVKGAETNADGTLTTDEHWEHRHPAGPESVAGGAAKAWTRPPPATVPGGPVTASGTATTGKPA